MINLKTFLLIGAIVLPTASYAEPPDFQYDCGDGVHLKYDELLAAHRIDEDSLIAKMKRGFKAQMRGHNYLPDVWDAQGTVSNLYKDHFGENARLYAEASESLIPNYRGACQILVNELILQIDEAERESINNQETADFFGNYPDAYSMGEYNKYADIAAGYRADKLKFEQEKGNIEKKMNTARNYKNWGNTRLNELTAHRYHRIGKYTNWATKEGREGTIRIYHFN